MMGGGRIPGPLGLGTGLEDGAINPVIGVKSFVENYVPTMRGWLGPCVLIIRLQSTTR